MPGQGFQEEHDIGNLPVTERLCQLHLAHDPDGVSQVIDRPVVKIRRRHFNVSENGYLEHIRISFIVCNRESSLVDIPALRILPVWFKDAKLLVRLATQVRA